MKQFITKYKKHNSYYEINNSLLNLLHKLPAVSKYIQQYKELKKFAPSELMKHLHINFGQYIGTPRHPSCSYTIQQNDYQQQ